MPSLPLRLSAPILAAVLGLLLLTPPTAAAQDATGTSTPSTTVPAVPAVPAAPPAPAPAAVAEPATGAAAVPAGAPAPILGELEAALTARLDSWRATLAQITATLGRSDLDDRALAGLRDGALEVRTAADEAIATLAPRIAALQARLAQLVQPEGAAPAVESDDVKRERELQTAALATLTGVTQQAQVARLSADEALSSVYQRRRELFRERVTAFRGSLFSPALWSEVAEETPRAVSSLVLLVDDWGRLIAARAGRAALAILVLVIVAGAVLAAPGRRYLLAIATREREIEEVPRLRKAAAATAVTLINVVVPLASLLVLRFAFDVLGLLPPRVDQALSGLIAAIGFLFLSRGLARGLLALGRPAWRLVSLGDAAADTVMRWLIAGTSVYAAGLAFVAVARVLAVPMVMIEVAQATIALVVAVIAAKILRIVTHDLKRDDDDDGDGEEAPSSRWRWLIPLAWLAVIATIALVVTGYLAFGWFLASQAIWTIAVLAILNLLLILVGEGIDAAFRPRTRVGNLLSDSLGFTRQGIEQIGVLLSGAGRLLLIFVALVMILAPLGLTSTDMFAVLSTAVFGLSIGGVTISPSAVIGAVVVFAVGVVATRALQHWVGESYLPRTRMDTGLKSSIRTGVGYVGTIAAGMLAFSVAGFNLQNVAIVAGALSVGIGFGLQSVVNNFVSGLILLAERPIKIGDWIVAGGAEGNVRRINVRSTEIQTFDGSVIIVPNSDLIASPVKNWNHANLPGRIMMPIGVAYDADPEQVRDILLACADEHPKATSTPAPFVQFVNFGESSLDFLLFVYVRPVNAVGEVKSDLHFAIMKRFKDAGIEIPYAQRDLRIRGLEGIEGLLARLAALPAETAAEVIRAEVAAEDANLTEPPPRGRGDRSETAADDVDADAASAATEGRSGKRTSGKPSSRESAPAKAEPAKPGHGKPRIGKPAPTTFEPPSEGGGDA